MQAISTSSERVRRGPGWSDYNRFRTRLKRALLDIDEETGLPNLTVVVNSLVKAAKHGDMKATEMIANRMDGRPREQVDVTDGAGRVIARVVFGGLDDPPAETPVIEQTKVIDVSPSVADVQK